MHPRYSLRPFDRADPAKQLTEKMNVSILWIVGGVGAVVAVCLAIFSVWGGQREDGDLGTLSNQWMSEHRLSGQSHDIHR